VSEPRREDMDFDLAIGGQSPRHIAGCLPTLSRKQIERHWREYPLHPRVRKLLFEKLCHEVERSGSQKFYPLVGARK
jgi:hypothetical protein